GSGDLPVGRNRERRSPGVGLSTAIEGGPRLAGLAEARIDGTRCRLPPPASERDREHGTHESDAGDDAEGDALTREAATHACPMVEGAVPQPKRPGSSRAYQSSHRSSRGSAV